MCSRAGRAHTHRNGLVPLTKVSKGACSIPIIETKGSLLLVGRAYIPRAPLGSNRFRTTTWTRGSIIAIHSTRHAGIACRKQNDGELEGTMDAKKLGGLMIALVVIVPIIATAPPGTLAWLECGLVGLLYVMRRRRLA